MGTTGADSSGAIALGVLLLLMGGAALWRSRRRAPVGSGSSSH
ncbi:LPXTG cell wall anchor domain-containing protein [Microbacterium sp.]